MRGGWDNLPHNLGSVKSATKETDTPFTKVSAIVWLPCVVRARKWVYEPRIINNILGVGELRSDHLAACPSPHT